MNEENKTKENDLAVIQFPPEEGKVMRVINCSSVTVQTRDLIKVNNWIDFCWLVSEKDHVLKCGSMYYCHMDTMVYSHEEKK